MLTKHRRAALTTAAAAFFFIFAAVSFAASPANFSGTWLLQGQDKNAKPYTLTVRQTDDAIEITEESEGFKSMNTLYLNGGTGPYRTSKGIVGSGLARWKGRDLLVETFVTSPPINGIAIRFHETQHWQLSKDGAVLKIHVDTDSPDMPPDITSAAIHPYTDIYKRSTP